MRLTSYTFDQALANRYLDLCFELYRGDDKWIPPLRRRVLRQFSPDFTFHRREGNAHRHFLATAGSRPVGHVTAVVNGRLADLDGTAVGTVGQFECVEDHAVAADLLAAATDWLRTEHGRRRVWGPMQFDIWHGYRAMTRGFETMPFFGEPYNKRYYPGLFERNGFVVRKRWNSVEVCGRAAIERRLEDWAGDHARALADGYRFAPIKVRNPEHVQALHRVVADSYRNFLGMTALDRDEFRDVLAAYAEVLDSRFTIGAWSADGAICGFAIAYPDHARAVQAMGGSDSLLARLRFLLRARTATRAVFFMLGITTEASTRRRGLGRALFHACLRSLVAADFESVVFALLAEDSPGWQVLRDCRAEAQKEYVLFEANLGA
jgi:ribosomal protein S18 acetylase RimI-like enzyme